jgi:hypothetical protein
MPVTQPYRRTCRQFVNGTYAGGGRWMYVLHPKFAVVPTQYVRAFELIQKDALQLFDYVEPADVNLNCYSYRIHELLMRACVEVEANCKAIMSENGYVPTGNWSMVDYKKLDATHHLSAYEVRLPLWHGNQNTRRPFSAWPAGRLGWYQAYNQSKHDRHQNFPLANFENLINAICGLVAVLGARFHTWDFSPAGAGLGLELGRPTDGFEVAIGDYFQIKFPGNWVAADQYDFDWEVLKGQQDPFQSLTF